MAALAELRGLLVRGLRAALHGRTGGADPSAEAMPLVQEHLHMCGECRDEFEALLTALRATGEA